MDATQIGETLLLGLVVIERESFPSPLQRIDSFFIIVIYIDCRARHYVRCVKDWRCNRATDTGVL